MTRRIMSTAIQFAIAMFVFVGAQVLCNWLAALV